MKDVLTIQNVALLLVVVGQGLAKYGTDAFSWNAFVATLVLTVLGWFGLNLQASYLTGRLALEERRLQLDAEIFDSSANGGSPKVRKF